MRKTGLTLVSLLAAAACGSSSDATPDAPTNPGDRYLPWTVGSVWNYKLTDPQSPSTPKLNQPTTIMRMEDVGGVHAGTIALVVHATQYNGSKDVWEAADGELDVRYKSVFYDAQAQMTGIDIDTPYRLKLDESFAHTTGGATWSTSFTEASNGGSPTTKNENWSVVSASEPVTVIAGTFTCLHVRRTSSGGTLQDYWYARGVGKVKETGGGQDEELMSYTIAP
ncbi:MAG TPA: hypothetical protein VIV40_36215 [Kofleriaceae bacterium]